MDTIIGYYNARGSSQITDTGDFMVFETWYTS